MTTNHIHYNLETLDPKLKALAEARQLKGPCFIGQGATYSSGTDTYGFYIVSIFKSPRNGKLTYGLARANEVCHSTWVEGSMDCSIDLTAARPERWVTAYGKSWYFCDSAGNRYNGAKCTYRWNGAYSYRDPSF